MNRGPLGLKLSRSLSGFLQYKTAESLSPNTLKTYDYYVKVWIAHSGDKELDQFTTADVREFLAWLRTEYKPTRFNGNETPLSPKSLRNVWIALCSFWTWANKEFDLPSPMKNIPAPRFEFPPIEPYTKEQIEKILKAAEYCREANTDRRKTFQMRRATARRDRAIILCLLDTGLRANELCSLLVGDFDINTGRLQVKHGITGGAKGGKGRSVYLGKTGRNALWRYLAKREDGEDPKTPLFCDRLSRPLKKDQLRKLLHFIGERAGVKRTYPHKFRHTFAINYLRNGGDVFTLQSLLGHSSLEMVQHYARIAEVDTEQTHRRASPADNWRL
jgi:integrase/recombinase XerD